MGERKQVNNRQVIHSECGGAIVLMTADNTESFVICDGCLQRWTVAGVELITMPEEWRGLSDREVRAATEPTYEEIQTGVYGGRIRRADN